MNRRRGARLATKPAMGGLGIVVRGANCRAIGAGDADAELLKELARGNMLVGRGGGLKSRG